MPSKISELLRGISVVVAATLIHFTYGYFYTLGNMAPYIISIIKNQYPFFDRGSTVWLSASSLAIQGVAMPLGGLLVPKLGFRAVVIIGCLLNSGGTLMTYFTIDKHFAYILITYSVITGFGLGLSYAVALAVAASWFPERRALIYGIITCGFGVGGIVFTPIQRVIINPLNIPVNTTSRYFTDSDVLSRVPSALLIFGGILMSIQCLGCLLLRPKEIEISSNVPDDNDESKSREPEIVKNNVDRNRNEINLTPLQVLRRYDFYLLWLVMFCSVIPITLITAAYKVVGSVHIDNDTFLSTVAMVSAIFNSGGRIIWGTVCDKFSFKIPITIMLLVWSLILLTLPHIFYWEAGKMALYAIWICALYLTLSGVFAMMPAATARMFGPKYLAVNYGLVFTAFSFGSVICAVGSDASEGHWTAMFTACAITCLIALFLLTWIDDPLMPQELNFCKPCTRIAGRNRCANEVGEVAI